MNRREFLLSSMTLTGAAAVAGSSAVSWADTAKRPLGVQLYTVRDQAEKDLPSVLAAIRNIGYEEVETYWNVYTHPAPELKRMINDHGLHVPSGHFNYDGLEGKFDYAAELGLEYMICPMLPEKGWLELDTYKKAAEQFNKWGEQARKRGMHFGFHNHNYEFHRFTDKAGKTTTGYDVLMSHTDPNLVCAELDCYWITQAGQDPLKMFNRLGKRIRMLHLKDRQAGFPPSQELNDDAKHFTPVGTGTIDWKKIVAVAEKNDIRHMFVEQDSGGIPLENIATSFKNVEAIL
jgi:sugar phosphate isomerase/epimerase